MFMKSFTETSATLVETLEAVDFWMMDPDSFRTDGIVCMLLE